MMAAFRAFAKSPVAIALLGLLIISFGVWGVRDAFKARISDSVVSAGSRQVNSAEFKRDFDLQLRNINQQSGQAISSQDAAARGLDKEVLQALVQQETLQEVILRSGILPSDQLFAEQLRKIPAFFNPVTGAFDKNQYRQLLQQNQVSEAQFEREQRDQIAAVHFLTGASAGMRAPLTYTAVFAAMNEQARSADWFAIDPRSVGTPTPPTDAQLTAMMKQFADRLRQPETRQISLVRFSAQNLAPTLTPDPAAVQKRFDFEKGRLSTPERRSFVQITLKNAGEAQAAAARLAKGEDPTAVAKSFGVKPISYANVPQATVPDPRVGEAAFKLQPGQASGPIQGEFNFAVVKLAAIIPAKPATLEDVRPQIETEVRAEAAAEKVYDQVQKYEDVHATGAQLVQAAKAAGVQVFSLPAFTSEGKTLQGQPVTGLNQKMVADVFNLTQGGETDVVDLGKGEYYAIRLEKVNPSALPSLDQIRAPLTQLYMQQQVVQRLKAKADGYVDRVKKGESMDAVAASAGSKVQHLVDTSRASAQQLEASLGREFLGQLFQGKPGDIYLAGGQNYGIAVVRVTGVRPGDVQAVAREARVLQPQLSTQMARQDLSELVINAARALVKPKIDEKLARRAIGLSDDASSAPPAKAPAK
jgi:peptidyl-prolyl cis-trans isomerase D